MSKTTHVAIIKYYKDVKRTKENEHLPDKWPAETVEFPSEEEAKKAYPNARILTLKEYLVLSEGLHDIVKDLRPLNWWDKLRNAF